MDAWEALLATWAEDDRLPCYHLTEKYSTDVLVASLAQPGGNTTGGTLDAMRQAEMGAMIVRREELVIERYVAKVVALAA
jgi:hypothetical protein